MIPVHLRESDSEYGFRRSGRSWFAPSRSWGTGTLSSSDGQRFPVSGKVRMATALPRYFGYGKGVTFYTWTADQFSQYGTKVIPTTVAGRNLCPRRDPRQRDGAAAPGA